MTVYLLHFSTPLQHSQHYLGWCGDERDPRDRLQDHLDGRGSGYVFAASVNGADVVVARTWPGASRTFERRLKRMKSTGKRLCPICSGRTSRTSPRADE